MTGFIFIVFNPILFEVQFILAEIIGYLSIQSNWDMLILIKISREAMSYAKQLMRNVITSWKYYLSYRLNLPMIW